jgi:hypothetical protein
LATLAALLAALASGLLLLLAGFLLATAALLTALTRLLFLLTWLLTTATLLSALAWILISHDLSFSCGKIPAKDNVHPAGTFLGEGDPINGFDSGAPRRRIE